MHNEMVGCEEISFSSNVCHICTACTQRWFSTDTMLSIKMSNVCCAIECILMFSERVNCYRYCYTRSRPRRRHHQHYHCYRHNCNPTISLACAFYDDIARKPCWNNELLDWIYGFVASCMEAIDAQTNNHKTKLWYCLNHIAVYRNCIIT